MLLTWVLILLKFFIYPNIIISCTSCKRLLQPVCKPISTNFWVANSASRDTEVPGTFSSYHFWTSPQQLGHIGVAACSTRVRPGEPRSICHLNLEEQTTSKVTHTVTGPSVRSCSNRCTNCMVADITRCTNCTINVFDK